MNKQTEIKESTVLLMPDGNLARPGYCKHNLFRYNPEMIKRENTMRLKEWDYYQISDGNIMIQLNFFNISLATCATFGLVNLKTGRKISGMATELFTPHKNRLSKTATFRTIPNISAEEQSLYLTFAKRRDASILKARLLAKRLNSTLLAISFPSTKA